LRQEREGRKKWGREKESVPLLVTTTFLDPPLLNSTCCSERQPVATVGGDQIGVLRLVPPPMSKVEETRVRVLQGGCTHAPTAYLLP